MAKSQRTSQSALLCSWKSSNPSSKEKEVSPRSRAQWPRCKLALNPQGKRRIARLKCFEQLQLPQIFNQFKR